MKDKKLLITHYKTQQKLNKQLKSLNKTGMISQTFVLLE